MTAKPSLANLMNKLKAAETRGPKAPAAAPPEVDAPRVASAEHAGDAAPGEQVAQAPAVPEAPRRPSEATMRALLVRRFVTELLRPGNRYNASEAYRKVVSSTVSASSSQTLGLRMLRQDDVLDELDRQLKGIQASADLDEEYVYRQWRSIAQSNIFDVLRVDANGRFQGFRSDPEGWTLEQQLMVRKMTFHDSGRLKSFELVDRQRAVDSIAKARKMFVYDESGTRVEDLAEKLKQRLSDAAKRTGRVFDNETGRILS